MNKPASLEDIAAHLADQHPKQLALGTLIQGIKLAQSRGAFSLGESSRLADAVLMFCPSPVKDSKESDSKESDSKESDSKESDSKESDSKESDSKESDTENRASADAPKGAAAPANDGPNGDPGEVNSGRLV